MNDALAERLGSRDTQIPTPMVGLSLLLDKLTSDDVEFAELVVAIEKFPSLTARLLSVANSAWCSPPAPITALKSACTHLGLRLIRSMSISLVVSSPFNAMRCPAFDSIRFWQSSLLVADGVNDLVSQSDSSRDVDVQAVQTAGLLHNVGLLWLADTLPEEVTRACELVAGGEADSLSHALQRIIDMDVAEVTALLLANWGLPVAITGAVMHHREADFAEPGWQATAFLGGAIELVAALHRGDAGPGESRKLDRVQVSEEARKSVFSRLQQRSEQMLDIATVLASA